MAVKTDNKVIKILLVDDSQTIRSGIALTLRRNGYKVEEAQDGMQALHMIEENTFNLVLLDYQMPLMSGYEVLLIMQGREELKYIPVLMLSGKASKEDILDCMKQGAKGYIVKSDNMNVLLKKISEICPLPKI